MAQARAPPEPPRPRPHLVEESIVYDKLSDGLHGPRLLPWPRRRNQAWVFSLPHGYAPSTAQHQPVMFREVPVFRDMMSRDIMFRDMMFRDMMFRDMFRALQPAEDLRLRYGIDAPTLRIDAMTLGGKRA